MKPVLSVTACCLFSAALLSPLARSQQRSPMDISDFEHRAQLSKELGATHMLVTEGLPLATWQLDRDDPYPAWFAGHAGLLTIFPPKDVAPYVDARYAAEMSALLQKRCTVLSRSGLKGVWNANEPAVLPEAFFTAHPELRGPRIDQLNRSRKTYFAPNVDAPETLRMYREAMQSLLKVCPEVEQFNWVTTDAGSGFDWTPGLYPGANGNSLYKDRALSDRVVGFLTNLQQAAKASGHDIRINLRPIEARQWMLPTFPPDTLHEILRKLPSGIAVEGREGPDGHPFSNIANIRTNSAAFYPVVGLVIPDVEHGGDLWDTASGKAPERFMVSFGDAASADFNDRLFRFTRGKPLHTLADRAATLRAFAVSEVGESQADNLLEAWAALNDAQLSLQTLNFGDMLRMGHVLNRWLLRPLVPFPEELTDTEKKDYRPFLLQAKGEEQASDVADIQAMRMYEGWGARLLFQRTIELAVPRVRRALTLTEGMAGAAKEDAARRQWRLTAERLQAVIYLLQSADDMVDYQAQLDRVRSLNARVETDPVLGTQSSWDRTDMLDIARRELDNTVELRRLLQRTDGPLLDMAASPQDETIMRLGPSVVSALGHKIDVMNAHWRDYDSLFTKPNP